METDQAQKLHDLLGTFATAMLVTHSSTGGLRARPMAIIEVEPSCRLWFISSEETAKIHQIENDTRVMVVCQQGEACHLSVNGTAHLERDRVRIARLWRDSFKIWFPEGKDDPHIVLIGVDPLDAEYWDHRGIKGVQYLFESARALLTKSRPRIEEGGEHGRVVMMP